MIIYDYQTHPAKGASMDRIGSPTPIAPPAVSPGLTHAHVPDVTPANHPPETVRPADGNAPRENRPAQVPGHAVALPNHAGPSLPHAQGHAGAVAKLHPHD